MSARSATLSRRWSPRSEAGFSLVELLIAVTLGLLILAGVGSVFLGSKQSFRSQESLGQVQESGRYVAYLLYPFIRQAGYLADPLLQEDPTAIFLPPASGLASQDNLRPLWGLESPGAPNAAGVLAVANTDIIVVRYLGQDAFGGGVDNTMRTCAGQVASSTQMVENTFFISLDEDGGRSLSCRGRVLTLAGTQISASTQPLIADVADLELFYGVDTNPADDNPPPPAQPGLFPNRFVSAADVGDWSRVIAVRVETLAVGDQATEGTDAGATVTGVGGDTIGFVGGDRRLQRAFTNTVLIRNRLRE